MRTIPHRMQRPANGRGAAAGLGSARTALPARGWRSATSRTVRMRRSTMRRWRTRPPIATGPASATRRKGRAPRDSRSRLVGGGRLNFGGGNHSQQIDAAAIGAQYAKLQRPDLNGFSAARQPPELLHQQAAGGVGFLVGKGSPGVVIEVGDRRERGARVVTRAA